MPLDPRGCLAEPTAVGITLRSSTQLPFIVRTVLAEALGVAEFDLRVVVPQVGGGFGAKMHVYGEELLVCLLARRFDRAIRWVETRSEHMTATVHAREVVNDVEVATDAQGHLLALRTHVLADMGTGCTFFPGVSPAAVTGMTMPGPYRLQEFQAEIICLVTNRTPTGAYRGFGQTEAVFAMERTLDLVARELLAYDADGQILTAGLTDYAVPTAVEIPTIKLAHDEFLPRASQAATAGSVRAASSVPPRRSRELSRMLLLPREQGFGGCR